MKRLLMLIALGMCSLIAAAAADAQCHQCGPQAVCRGVAEGERGYVECSGGWTDCHDGTVVGPCAPHCHVAGNPSPYGPLTDCQGGCASFSAYSCPWPYCGTECTSAVPSVVHCCDDNGNQICDQCEGPETEDPEGGGGGGGTGGPPCGVACTPLAINTSLGGPWRLSGKEFSPVSFDLDADGTKDLWTWTAPTSGIGLVAYDRNGNGVVDDGGELFGNQDPAHVNGFAKLSEFDSDGDEQITTKDARWPALRLWVDANHNGVSELDELKPLGAHGIEALSLRYNETSREKDGVAFRYGALVQIRGRAERYYDLVFKRVAPYVPLHPQK